MGRAAPTRALGAVDARSPVRFASVSQLRVLPDGSLLVHDVKARRLVLLDSALDSLALVADATGATGTAYNSVVGGLLPWLGDSSLFADPEVSILLTIDRDGRIARIGAVPPALGGLCLMAGPAGQPATDARGRILCRMPPAIQRGVPHGTLPIPIPEIADTAALVRYDLVSRHLDTAAFLRVPRAPFTLVQNDDCAWMLAPMIDPLPIVDAWTLMPDGTIAVVRGADYHVDWIAPDGSRSASAPLPFQRKALSPEAKAAFVDSTRAALLRLRAGSNPGAVPAGAPDRQACDATHVSSVQIFRPEMAFDPTGAAEWKGRIQPPLLFVSPSELPDHVPAFGAGGVRADLDGRLWIRTTQGVDGSAIHHVVDRAGRLLFQVAVPPGRTILGFGPHGAVFMAVAEGSAVRLERARIE